MRAIALAIVLGLEGIAMAIIREPILKQSNLTLTVYLVCVVGFFVCLILGI